MDGHFRAFSFVDRITSREGGRHVRGSYFIPPGVKAFPLSLVAEAVGQLAAWEIMLAQDFKRRAVAGLAAAIDLLSEVRPGQVLSLEAELETVDEDVAAYHGSAHVEGVPIIRLHHCVGPMVLVEEFDDPKALRERFDLLCGSGAIPGAFGGVPSFELESAGGENGQSMRARLHVPREALFFTDHFPRRPVLPGTLLMNSNLELVASLAAQFPPPAAGGKWVMQNISDVKLRAFTPPGDILEIETRLAQLSEAGAIVEVENRKGKRTIGGCRVRLVPGDSV